MKNQLQRALFQVKRGSILMRKQAILSFMLSFFLFFPLSLQSCDRLIIGHGQQVESLHPFDRPIGRESKVALSLFEGLMRFDLHHRLRLASAQAALLRLDGRQVLFKIDPKAKWSNGEPLTAHHFLQRWYHLCQAAQEIRGQKEVVPHQRELLLQWEYLSRDIMPIQNLTSILMGLTPPSELGIIAPDDHTLIFQFERPLPSFKRLLALLTRPSFAPSCSQRLEEEWSAWQIKGSIEISPHALTTGIYRLARRDGLKSIELERNPWTRPTYHATQTLCFEYHEPTKLHEALDEGLIDLYFQNENHLIHHRQRLHLLPTGVEEVLYFHWHQALDQGKERHRLSSSKEFKTLYAACLGDEQRLNQKLKGLSLFSPTPCSEPNPLRARSNKLDISTIFDLHHRLDAGHQNGFRFLKNLKVNLAKPLNFLSLHQRHLPLMPALLIKPQMVAVSHRNFLPDETLESHWFQASSTAFLGPTPFQSEVTARQKEFVVWRRGLALAPEAISINRFPPQFQGVTKVLSPSINPSKWDKVRDSSTLKLGLNVAQVYFPYQSKNATDNYLCSMLFEGLFAYDVEGELKVKGGMVDRWEQVTSTHWIFDLNPEAKWSDGSPLLAEDFVRAWRMLCLQKDPFLTQKHWQIFQALPLRHAEAIFKGYLKSTSLGVEASQPHRLELHLSRPVAQNQLFDLLSRVELAPLHRGFEKEIHPKLCNGRYVLSNPTDQFEHQQISSFIQEERFLLSLNPHHPTHQKNRGLFEDPPVKISLVTNLNLSTLLKYFNMREIDLLQSFNQPLHLQPPLSDPATQTHQRCLTQISSSIFFHPVFEQKPKLIKAISKLLALRELQLERGEREVLCQRGTGCLSEGWFHLDEIEEAQNLFAVLGYSAEKPFPLYVTRKFLEQSGCQYLELLSFIKIMEVPKVFINHCNEDLFYQYDLFPRSSQVDLKMKDSWRSDSELWRGFLEGESSRLFSFSNSSFDLHPSNASVDRLFSPRRISCKLDEKRAQSRNGFIHPIYWKLRSNT